MAVTKRREAERAVVLRAQVAEDAIRHALGRVEKDIEDLRYDARSARHGSHRSGNVGTILFWTAEAEELGALLAAVERLNTLPRRSIDTPTPAVRDDATDTSRLAARRVLARHGTLRRTVYDAVAVRRQGMTDKELEALLGITHESLSSARNSLVNSGWLVDSGERRRFGGSGPAIVWKVAVRWPTEADYEVRATSREVAP